MSPKRLLRTALLLALPLVLLPAWAQAQGTGQLAGSVTGKGDTPISGVTVVVNDLAMAEITNDSGRYLLSGLPPGKYTVTFSLSDNSQNATVEIAAGSTARLDQKVDWDVSYAETITVYSASRKRERIVEAPSAVTVVSEQDVDREAAHGQLAKVLEFTPGVELTQSGLYDFNLNTRGFNSSLNRRVPALIDGRDPSVPFLMSTDWPSLSSMGDIASVELVRGPSSALYGTNAYNGILNLTTKQPRYSQGGTFRLTGGELSTARADARWAGGLSDSTYLKFNGGYTKSDDFYQSRNLKVEYSHFCNTASVPPESHDCIPREVIPLKRTDDELWLGGVRLDHYFGERFLTLEGGTSHAAGPVVQTGIGRVQVVKQDRPWGRLNFSTEHFDVLGYYNKRDAPEQWTLASNRNLNLQERSWAGEVQGNVGFAGSKGQLIGGVSYKDEHIDTLGTLTFAPVGTKRKAAYAQLSYDFTPKFKAVLAARYDDSDLHAAQTSPKVALVFAPTPNQTFRLSYNEAFQSPNYSEFFLAAPAAADANLLPAFQAFAPQLLPFATAAGFGDVRILARGNANLHVEKVKSWEAGYSGILGGKAYLTLDVYRSELSNFVTDLLRGLDFDPAYQFPCGTPAAVQTGILQLLGNVLNFPPSHLTNLPGGAPALVAASYTNAGNATTKGLEMGLNYYVTDHWNWGLNYNYFDFSVDSTSLAKGDEVLPNAPANQFSSTLGYTAPKFDVSLGYRWVEKFRWAVAAFVGDVPSYSVLDVTANYHVSDHVQLGINVSNALDKKHWEAFDGDLIRRRALGSVTFSW